jgi:DEAD/DEAH box helicase domain-containing protein
MIPLTVADQIRTTLLDYLTTTFNFQDEAVEQALLRFLEDGRTGLFKGPYVNLRLPFRRAGAEEAIPLAIRPDFLPYVHQARAFQRLSSQEGRTPQPTVITTGTGSGKTESFLFPILDHCFRHCQEPGIKAIILYPMNALATDQAMRLAKAIWRDERLRNQVTAGIYVGGESKTPRTVMGPDWLIDDRETLRRHPPHILLTNYRMLDFLLLRPEDRELWARNGPQTLRYLVLDELHTYDGAQGSDVACLIRRLRARLSAPVGAICPVGTSATVGDLPLPGAEAAADGDSAINRLGLPGFASQIFGQPIGVDAIIGEDRLAPADFLPAAATHFDFPADVEALNEEPGEPYLIYLERQCRAWFGQTLDVYALGEALASHRFLGVLLAATQDRILALDDLTNQLARWEPEFAAYSPPAQAQILQSFLALIAHARVQSGRQDTQLPMPFLTLQVQLWVREMRRLMRTVAAEPAFFWRDDAPDLASKRGLPPYFCRDCGHSGWLATLRQGDERLNDNHAAIYHAYFERSRHCCYVYPGVDPGRLPGAGWRLCPRCLHVGFHEACPDCAAETFPVMIHRELSQPRTAKGQPQDLQRCPHCGSDNALSIVGSQAASLSSVAIGHLYTSPLNTDKKLLAFTDSVQDAAHRAAFFGARTYRFNLRTAFQAVLEAAGEPIPLNRFTDQLLDYWRTHWRNRADRELHLAATFIPPDLCDDRDYRTFIDEAAAHRTQPAFMPSALQHTLHRRLSWEVAMEYAFNARLGRSLEKVGSSTAYVDPRRLRTAVERLALRLRDEVGLAHPLDEGRLHHFVAGLLERTRLRGGVAHDFLEKYAREQGSWFLLSKKQQPLLSPFHKRSRLPKLLTDSTRRDVFDCFRGGAQDGTWFVDWARRTLVSSLGVAEINEIYALAVSVLEDRGLLHRYSSGHDNAWAIEPALLLLTPQTASLRCDHSHDGGTGLPHQHTVAAERVEEWLGRACLSYKCTGVYTTDSRPALHYYQALYQRGELARIFSHEHTGLLDRQTREEIEMQFKTQSKADAINLLAATPTLEMGIDVGDLSGAMACSVPPAPANYLQRIGRSGRATGNSLILTLANATPHDLYFFEEPLEMIAGAITPPGCFLNAPNMLKRQFLAFCLDCWTAAGDEARFPRTVRDLLAQAERGGFPEPFLTFYQQERAGLVDAFLGLFGDEVTATNRQEIRDHAAGAALPAAIRAAIEATREEREDLRRLHRRYRQKQQEIEGDPAEYEDPQAELKRIQQDAALVLEMIRQIDESYILNFFTDAGLLPNYAFPESGVKLRAVVTFDTPRPNGKAYEVREYQRPAPVAIRELAPFNSFYAEARKLQITHVELPGRDKAIERWQFCDRCGHMSMVQSTHYSTTCPQCGSTHWSDTGQQHNMVRFQQAASWTQDYDSRVGDDDDEREQAFYQSGRYFAIDPEQLGHAQLIASLPFGFEYLREVTLREINFGAAEEGGGTVMIADEERSEQGFRVCRDCGVALPSKEDPDAVGLRGPKHTRNCQFRSAQTHWEKIYLYREMKSEALRILLPVSTMLVDETLASVSAALHLGLRRWLGGEPDHLQILPHTEVGRDGTRRRFLVIYDNVPGGTSYLRDLARPQVFRAVLALARDALASCPCRHRPEKKACHRCLYSFRSQSRNGMLDRALALQRLQEILEKYDQREEVHSLGDVDMVSVLESELEARFVEALRSRAEESKSWRLAPILHRGETAWLLTIGGRRWRVEPQVSLGYDEGIHAPTRPDFVLRPLDDENVRPVAVYTDGFAYHARPGDLHGQIASDIHKRRNLWQSGQFWVWSITWEDIALFTGSSKDALLPFLSSEQQLMLKQLKPALSPQLALSDGMTQLMAYLAQPAAEAWSHFATALAAAMLDLRNRRPPLARELLDEMAHKLCSARTVDLTIPARPAPGEILYNIVERSFNRLLIYAHPDEIRQAGGPQLVLRLQDSYSHRAGHTFAQSWRYFLLLMNLFQFLPNFTPTSDETVDAFDMAVSLAQAGSPAAPATPAGVEGAPAWQEAMEWADPCCRPLLEACQSAHLDPPAVGWELLGERQRVVAMAELAWEAAKLAVLLDGAEEERQHFATAGWQPFCPDDVEAILLTLCS